MQDADQIVAECGDLISKHQLDPKLAREVVAKAMLGEQPLPLKGKRAMGERLPPDVLPSALSNSANGPRGGSK